jgi:hypothetical protein
MLNKKNMREKHMPHYKKQNELNANDLEIRIRVKKQEIYD